MLNKILNVAEKIILIVCVLLLWTVFSCILAGIIQMIAYLLFGPSTTNPTFWFDWRWFLLISGPIAALGLKKFREFIR